MILIKPFWEERHMRKVTKMEDGSKKITWKKDAELDTIVDSRYIKPTKNDEKQIFVMVKKNVKRSTKI
jgi:hypothetical protein